MNDYYENNSTSNKTDIISNNSFPVIILFSSIFIIIYLIYLIIILKYIFKNCIRNKICVYWIDYSILIFSGIMFIIIYIINLAIFGFHNIRHAINTIYDLSSDIYSTLIIIFLIIMCITIINSLLFDSILACKLSYAMNKIKKIEEKDFGFLSEKLKEVNVVDILKFKFTFPYHLTFIIIDIIYIVLAVLLYKDTNIDNFDNFLNLRSYINYLLRLYHLCVLVLLIISIIIMIYNKKSLLRKHYYNSNRLAQRIYNVYFNQIIYSTDFLSFKLVFDLIMNIPALLFLSMKKFDTASLVISEFSIFIYIILGGGEYLTIDKNNKAAKLNKKIKILFCLKNIDFHFGEKDHNFIFDQFKFNYTNEEENIFNKLNMTVVKNLEKNIFEGDENDISININNDEELELNESSENIFIEKQKKLEFKTISEFYLIQKLMMLYFKENKRIYESNSDFDGENISIFSISNSMKKQKMNNKILNIKDKNNYISKIEQLNRISIIDSKKLKNCLNYSSYNIFHSIEEKELLEEIKTIFNIKDKNNNFKIENILSSELFELFPFYQMNINLILNSLEPSLNIKIFNKFVNRNKNRIKDRISRFSVKSTYNNNYINEEKNEKEIDNNLYYTNDLYLMYEIFEVDEFINYQKLKDIILEYNKYLLSIIKKMSYSFLPLIIGIFNIEIFNNRIIIILYRNPLYFTKFNNFNQWLNFYLNEKKEKMKVSSLFNDIIEINEIDIKNNLQLNEMDFDEIKQILNNDFSFIKKIKEIFPIINIFIGEESNNDDNKGNKNIENSILDESSNKNKNIVEIIDKDISISNIDNNIINENSLFEKEYLYMNGNNIKSIKIYFTNFFRNNYKLNYKNSNNYCDFILNKVIKYMSKKTLFDEDNKEE